VAGPPRRAPRAASKAAAKSLDVSFVSLDLPVPWYGSSCASSADPAKRSLGRVSARAMGRKDESMGHVFEPEVLHEIARRGVGKPSEEMFSIVLDGLRERYPDHVRPTGRWIFNNAGGAMGALMLLHASLSEYLIFFGSPIGTEGHSGRYVTEVHDFMMAGEMWCYHDGEVDRTVYEPGDAAYLGASRVKGYRLPDAAWMLEYARGPIVTMLPFGLLDVVTSTLDYTSFGRTLFDYGRLVVGQLRQGKI
jgi:C-8 sterol isomerase